MTAFFCQTWKATTHRTGTNIIALKYKYRGCNAQHRHNDARVQAFVQRSNLAAGEGGLEHRWWQHLRTLHYSLCITVVMMSFWWEGAKQILVSKLQSLHFFFYWWTDFKSTSQYTNCTQWNIMHKHCNPSSYMVVMHCKSRAGFFSLLIVIFL